MLKKIYFALFSCVVCFGICFNSYAEEIIEEVFEEDTIKSADDISSQALDDYDVEGSLFQRITDLEQEKLVMQLETERIKMDLELDRLNKEKIKLQKELDEMSGVEDAASQTDMALIRAEIETQTEQLKKQIEELQKNQAEQKTEVLSSKGTYTEESESFELASKYKLINVIGVGNQLQATVQDIATGQNKRIAVGKTLDGYVVKSISLSDGIVLERDGVSENLNVGR